MPRDLGPYVLEAPLGEGGMGVVHAAWHRRWGLPVAVKVLRSGHDAQAVEAFRREVRAVAALDHPDIVRVEDQGLVDGLPWLAMERCQGPVAPGLDWPAVRRALRGLLGALGAAHAAGMLHLDVKASNLLWRDDGSVALADFGIAMLREAEVDLGTHWGSPPYMAPERFDLRPERLGPWTDLYAVGVVAFELLHHGLPFGARTWRDAAEAHRTRPPPPLVPRCPVPPGVGPWVRTLLAKRPGDRFEQAADALAALDALGEAPALVGPGRSMAAGTVPTLPATVAGEVLPVAELLPLTSGPAAAPLPAVLPARRTRPQRRGGGGLLGLLTVPFVGREDLLQRLWSTLARGGQARIRGGHGVGCSRLGDHLMARVRAAGGAVVGLRGRDPRPLRDALGRVLLGVHRDLPEARRREGVALRLRQPPEAEAVAIVLAGLDDEEAAGRALRVWAEGARRPVWLWADDVGPGALADWVEAWPGPRLVGSRGVAMAGEVFDVPPLDDEALRAMLADWVGLSAEVVTELAARAEGDPGLAARLVRDGVEGGALVADDAGWRRVPGVALPLPDDAVAAWRRRLPSLSGAERARLEEGAVLGPLVEVAHLTDAAGVDGARAALVAAGLAHPTATGWRWVSGAARAAVLETFPAAATHRAVAATFTEADRWTRGEHRLEAGEVAEGGWDLVAKASDVIAQGRMVHAAAWLERLWDALDGAVPLSDPLWGHTAQCRAVLGPTHQGYAQTMAWAQRAVALSEPWWREEPEWRRARRRALGQLHWLANVRLMPTVAEPAMAAVAELMAEDGPEGWAHHLDHCGWTHLTLGRPEAAMEAFATAARDGARHQRYVSAASLGVAMRHAGHPDAVEQLTVAGRAMLDAGYGSARADLAFHLGDAERHRGRPEAAMAHYDEAVRASSEGDARADIGFLVHRALCLRALGRADEAQRALVACREQLDDDGPTWEAVIDLHLAVGAPPGAEATEALIARLEATRYHDPDVALSARALAERPDAPSSVRDFATAQLARYPYL